MTARCVVISGCSGGGKSTLLEALAVRGIATFAEPGRQIVKAELAAGGDALPWRDVQAFAHACIRLGRRQYEAAQAHALSFHDRSVVDAASALAFMQAPITDAVSEALAYCRYHARVFTAPPWPELYRADAERRHTFDDAIAEYARLLKSYGELGYELIELPRRSVTERVDFVLAALDRS